MIPSRINGRWDIVLPEDRHIFHRDRPAWEAERLASMYERLEEGMTVFDVGAESGDFTTLYKMWVGEKGEVIPFEPSIPYWPSIRQTFEANGFTAPSHTFAGFASHLTDLRPPKATGNPGIFEGWPPEYSVGAITPEFGFRHLAQDAPRTPQITLDDFVRGTAIRPSALMLDIEGAEWNALSGANFILDELMPLVWVSIHPETLWNWYGKKPEDIFELMWKFGYRGKALAPLGRDGEDYWLFEIL